jgi:hypothetical protein
MVKRRFTFVMNFLALGAQFVVAGLTEMFSIVFFASVTDHYTLHVDFKTTRHFMI